MQIVVQTITDSAIDLADARNSQFVDQSGTPSSELIRYVNLAYRDVYQQIIGAKEMYFTTPYNFDVVSTVESYALPSDFYKLDGVDLVYDPERRLTLMPLMFKERNRYRNSPALFIPTFGLAYRYTLLNGSITFTPIPRQTNSIILWYTPEPVKIVSFSDTLTLPIGCDEYMSLYVACAMLSKEESDTSQLNAKRLEVLDQLKNSLKDRDQGSASYIVDDSDINAFGWYPTSNR